MRGSSAALVIPSTSAAMLDLLCSAILTQSHQRSTSTGPHVMPEFGYLEVRCRADIDEVTERI